MKALNRKDRNRSHLKMALYFALMLCVAILGLSFQNQASSMHLGDLLEKKDQYEYGLYAQSNRGLKVDAIIIGLKELRADQKLNNLQHKRIQQQVNKRNNEMQAILLEEPDTSQSRIKPLPAVYDSLAKTISLIQATRDSIKACENKISNLKFSLNECLEAYKKDLADERDKEEGKK